MYSPLIEGMPQWWEHDSELSVQNVCFLRKGPQDTQRLPRSPAPVSSALWTEAECHTPVSWLQGWQSPSVTVSRRAAEVILLKEIKGSPAVPVESSQGKIHYLLYRKNRSRLSAFYDMRISEWMLTEILDTKKKKNAWKGLLGLINSDSIIFHEPTIKNNGN